MPIYEYYCKECGKAFEVIVRRGRENAVTCPACGSKNPRKLMSVCTYIGGEGGGGTSSCAGCSAATCATCGK